VVLDGAGVTTELMQAIAREFNLSETVFVLPPADPAHTRALRIFTPAHELPFAGHPTIGAAHVLAATGEIALCAARTEIVLEEGVGPVRVTIDADGDAPGLVELLAQRPPEFGPSPPSREALARLLRLSADDLAGRTGAAGGLLRRAVPIRLRRRSACPRPRQAATVGVGGDPRAVLGTQRVCRHSRCGTAGLTTARADVCAGAWCR
jgi:trans-2,3-dihydro-3-hydroxyanthranilate isomerase